MSKKVTMRDIAREAGVSVATVSYVLNDKDDSRISEDTKRKIWQLVNLYNYRINFSAKCLSSGNTDVVTIYIGDNDVSAYKAETMLLIQRLSDKLASVGYSLQVTFDKTVKRVTNCDAIICYNTDNSFFRALGEVNFCPLLALDTVIPNGDLFYQITTDYNAVAQKANSLFGTDNWTAVALKPNSEDLKERLLQQLNHVRFIEDDSPVSTESQNVVVLGSMVSKFCQKNAPNVLTIDSHSDEKIDKIVECLDIAINRKEAVSSDIRI